MIQIEPLTERTLPGIIACERENVEKWFRYYSITEKEKATYNELSPEQRWLHGGPTMDLQLFSNYWLESRQAKFDRYDFYVALEDEKVVGFIGALFTRESAIPGKHAYIDLLLVHPRKRRQGVASKLLQKIETIALDISCQSLVVFPEEREGPSGKFYAHHGFRVWQERYNLSLETTEKPSLNHYLFSPPEKRAENWQLLFGWNSTSAKAWLMLNSNFEKDFFECKRTVRWYSEKGIEQAVLGVIHWSSLFSTGPAYLWLLESQEKNKTIKIAKYIEALRHLGFSIGLKTIELTFLSEHLPLVKQLLPAIGSPVKLAPLLIKRLPKKK